MEDILIKKTFTPPKLTKTQLTPTQVRLISDAVRFIDEARIDGWNYDLDNELITVIPPAGERMTFKAERAGFFTPAGAIGWSPDDLMDVVSRRNAQRGGK